jgi:hypothetical protein
MEAVEIATAPTFLASVIVACWLVGVEYSQHTIGRAISADPRRLRFGATKVGVAALSALSVTARALCAVGVAVSHHSRGAPTYRCH